MNERVLYVIESRPLALAPDGAWALEDHFDTLELAIEQCEYLESRYGKLMEFRIARYVPESEVQVVVGDRVRIVRGLYAGRAGVVMRIQRQTKGERKVIYWIEVAPGERHVFTRDAFNWAGHVEMATSPKDIEDE